MLSGRSSPSPSARAGAHTECPLSHSWLRRTASRLERGGEGGAAACKLPPSGAGGTCVTGLFHLIGCPADYRLCIDIS